MTENPLISIIIPLYNKEKYIRDTLQSCLAQDYDKYEIIVVDDGSKDGSADVVRSFKDERIRYIWQENAGVSAARNHGAKEATGEWIFMLDADDTISPYTLSLFIKTIEQEPNAKVFVGQMLKGTQTALFVSNLGYVHFSNNPFKPLFCRKFFPNAGMVLVHRSTFDKVKYKAGCSFFEDGLYYLQLMREFPYWAWHNVPIFVHPLDGTGLSATKHSLEVEGAFDLSKQHYCSIFEALCYLDLIGMCQWSRQIYGDMDGVAYYEKRKKELFTWWQRLCYKTICKIKDKTGVLKNKKI